MLKLNLVCTIQRGFIEGYVETLPCQEMVVNYKELSIKSWMAKGRGLYFIVEQETQLEYGRGKTPRAALANAIEHIEYYTQGNAQIWDNYIQKTTQD